MLYNALCAWRDMTEPEREQLASQVEEDTQNRWGLFPLCVSHNCQYSRDYSTVMVYAWAVWVGPTFNASDCLLFIQSLHIPMSRGYEGVRCSPSWYQERAQEPERMVDTLRREWRVKLNYPAASMHSALRLWRVDYDRLGGFQGT